MPKTKTWTYEVQGYGLFPMDMLRYDRCFPRTSADALMLDANRHERTIQLESNKTPTTARWYSFGWSVRAIDVS